MFWESQIHFLEFLSMNWGWGAGSEHSMLFEQDLNISVVVMMLNQHKAELPKPWDSVTNMKRRKLNWISKWKIALLQFSTEVLSTENTCATELLPQKLEFSKLQSYIRNVGHVEFKWVYNIDIPIRIFRYHDNLESGSCRWKWRRKNICGKMF